MTKTPPILALLALLFAACSRPGGGPSASPSPPLAAEEDAGRPLPSPMPEIVARVNGQPIRLPQILPLAKAQLDRLQASERDRWAPEILRSALRQYVDRELLLQEALARGIRADAREVDWAYDQMRKEHPGEQAWNEFLARQGLDPQSLRTELRAQRTVAALLQVEATGRQGGPEDAKAALLARLRAQARIELLL
jgi:hypothetical protein